METARGIIQIESGKNYYWWATRPEPGLIPRDRICEYEEEKRSWEAKEAGASDRKTEEREREKERTRRSRRSRRRESRERAREEEEDEGRGGDGRRNGRQVEEVR